MSDPDPYDLLVQSLPLPDQPYLELLNSVLTKLSFKVDIFHDIYGWKSSLKPVAHHRAENSRGSMALLHVPKEIIFKSGSLPALFSLAVAFVRRVNGIFVFSGAEAFDLDFQLDGLQPLERSLVASGPPLKGAKIYSYEAIKLLAKLSAQGDGLESVEKLLLFGDLFPPAPPPTRPLISDEDFNSLVEILMNKADEVDPIDSRTYYHILINQAALSDEFRRNARDFSGNSELNAQMLLRRALAQNRNPEDPNYTTLGSLLKPLLNKNKLNPEHQQKVAGIIYLNKLYFNQQELDKLAQDFGIPI